MYQECIRILGTCIGASRIRILCPQKGAGGTFQFRNLFSTKRVGDYPNFGSKPLLLALCGQFFSRFWCQNSIFSPNTGISQFLNLLGIFWGGGYLRKNSATLYLTGSLTLACYLLGEKNTYLKTLNCDYLQYHHVFEFLQNGALILWIFGNMLYVVMSSFVEENVIFGNHQHTKALSSSQEHLFPVYPRVGAA